MKTVFGIIAAGAVVVFLALGIARTRQEEEVLSINRIQQQEGVPVNAAEVKMGDVKVVARFYGDVRSGTEASVTSRLMERIERIFVDVGDRVVKGQPLVKFATEASQAAVEQRRLAMENARRNYERAEALFDQGAVSRQMLDAAKLAYDINRENYHSAQNSVVLNAPISGRIARIKFLEGQLVKPGDVVLTIVEDDSLEVRFNVIHKDRLSISEGLPVKIYVKGLDPVDGVITDVSLEADPKTRMFPVTAKIPAVKGIYAGITVVIDVTIRQRDNVLTVPVDAVLERTDGKVVVAIVDGKVRTTPVEVGLQDEKQAEIISGLSEGDLVAVYGQSGLEDGTLVKVVSP